MPTIEPLEPDEKDGLTGRIRDFWTRNVNAEKIMGADVSTHARGDQRYFADLETQRYRSHRHLIPWITSMASGKTVLEIGSGVGLDSYTIAKHGMQITACDLTFVGVATAKKRFQNEGLPGNFSVCDAAFLPFAAGCFDYVYSFGVLHHAADTAATIDEVHRVLRRGGEARIMLYHRHSLNELIHRITRIPFEDKNESCPVVRRYSRAEIHALFHKFSKVDLEIDYLYGEGYGIIFRLTPRWLYDFLSKFIGWHILIKAVK
jgi:ubiquinone/menaquinone biosynthesis C-methylase UbiE